MHCAGRQRQPVGLRAQSAQDVGVTVSLVDGRVGADAIEVAAAVDVVDPDTFGPADHDGKRRVVRCGYPLGLLDDVLLGAHGPRRFTGVRQAAL